MTNRGRPNRAVRHGSDYHDTLLPWLSAAAVIAVVTLGIVIVSGGEVDSLEMWTLLASLFATIAVAGLVASRIRRSDAVDRLEDQARPPRDELGDGCAGEGPWTRSYIEGMAQWTTAFLELLEHATTQVDDPVLRRELSSARDDTVALRTLLQENAAQPLGLHDVATLHSVCALWETTQERVELLAAGVDPRWHRVWRSRSVIEWLLRHGPPDEPEQALPYRS